jgi:uncharacterized protein YdaU (DUF1376 family)
MPLYIADYLKDTTHLGALESGAYLHLIMGYWQNGRLPNDDRQLARIAKLTDREWKKAKPLLQAFFHDGWQHKRIDAELAHASHVSEQRKKAVAEREQKKKQTEINSTSNDGSNDASDDDTLHTSQRKKDSTADAVSAKYAFEDGIIRLNQRDFDNWTKSYSHLDLAAELLSLSKWAGNEGKNWFHAVKGALAKRNREVKATKDRRAENPEQAFRWNGMEGVI